MAAVFWLCEGSIIICLLNGDLFERLNEIVFVLKVKYEFLILGLNTNSWKKDDKTLLSFTKKSKIFFVSWENCL